MNPVRLRDHIVINGDIRPVLAIERGKVVTDDDAGMRFAIDRDRLTWDAARFVWRLATDQDRRTRCFLCERDIREDPDAVRVSLSTGPGWVCWRCVEKGDVEPPLDYTEEED